MNIKKNIRMKKKTITCMVIMLTILMNVLPTQARHLSDENQHIKLEGIWSENIKSLATDYCISATKASNIIFIQNTSPDRPITIQITNETGTTVYEETMSQEQTNSITISIATLSEGEYEITLTGYPIGFLTGTFTK